jgi:hypothetical protein
MVVGEVVGGMDETVTGRKQVRPCNAQGKVIELQLPQPNAMHFPGCEDRV